MKGKKVLVTGGAGFIGSNLARSLSSDNEVMVLDDLSTGDLNNLEGVDHTFINADIRTVKTIPGGIDIVFHLAAYISVPGSVLEPARNDAINIIGTQNVLSAAKDAGVEKLVFASSAAVYGDVPEDQLPITEDMELRPASPYAGSKMTAEDYCSLYYNMFGLRTTVLRIFNGYGPRQNPDSPYAAAIPAFIKRVVAGEPPTIFGDGEQTRDFVFVGDIARAFELAAERKEADGQVINIASGSKTSVNRLVQDICRLAGVDLEPVHEEPRPGDIRHSVASVERAKKLLGWEATTPLSKGLKATMDWSKETGR